jgi:hypothetical protein
VTTGHPLEEITMSSDVTYKLTGHGVEITYATAARTLDLALHQPITPFSFSWQLDGDSISVTDNSEYGCEVGARVDLGVDPHVEQSYRLTIYVPPVTNSQDSHGRGPAVTHTVHGLLVVVTIPTHRVDHVALDGPLPVPTFAAEKLTGTVTAAQSAAEAGS